ncbi:uncharacterized LOC105272791 [Fopius arisanus]|uniref:Uncharacterized LOC105272791 n=1 Tax=Fopius arisanus TaxID=64838 RepID=A0AAR9IBB4_9HYME|nr:uncharacterized LOC105272791 [Fopius arisanus]KAG8362509.1 EcKinase 12 [Fopius arisanus]
MDNSVIRKSTHKLIGEVMKKYEPDVEILQMNEEPGTRRGDNYTSMLYRLRLNGRKRLKSGDCVPWETAIIYKVLPESQAHRDYYQSELLFKNEVVFYNHVWPIFKELQKDGREVFFGVAEVYVAQSDLIAMEDLKRKGYVMADRRKGLEMNRLKPVLKALAGFHALSLTLRNLRPAIFDRFNDQSNPQSIREGFFRIENEEWYRQYYRSASKNAISMVSEALPPEHESRRGDIMEKLEAFLQEDVFFRRMCELAATPGPLTVICHGDCWTNNFLFSDQATDAEPVYLVDFQLIRIGSLALDLVNLLYVCTSAEVRRTQMTSLLRHYHSNLMTALHTLDPDNKDRDPAMMWSLLNDEMRRYARFGLGAAIDMIPITTCESDEAPDLYREEGDSNEGHEVRGPPLGGNQCARLMTDLVLEFFHKSDL